MESLPNQLNGDIRMPLSGYCLSFGKCSEGEWRGNVCPFLQRDREEGQTVAVNVSVYPNPSTNLFKTTVAEISRLAASGMTIDCGLSMISSVTIMLRRTGRQCMK